jgi:hypothetical protein
MRLLFISLFLIAYFSHARSIPTFSYTYQTNGVNETIVGVTGIATDMAGNNYIVGNYGSDVVFGNGVNITYPSNCSAGPIGFIAKQLVDGTWSWVITLSSSYTSTLNAIAIDNPGNNIYVTGTFQDDISFSPSLTFTTTNLGRSAFVAQFDSFGVVSWASYTQNDKLSYAEFNAIALDTAKNIYVAGSYYRQVKILSTNYTSYTTKYRVLVAKLSSGGAWQFSNVDSGTEKFHLPAASEATSIYVTTPGAPIYVSGHYRSGATVLGSYTLPRSNKFTYRFFIATMDQTGAWTGAVNSWNTGSYSGVSSKAMVIANNSIFVAGGFVEELLLTEEPSDLSVYNPNNLFTFAYIAQYTMSLVPQYVASIPMTTFSMIHSMCYSSNATSVIFAGSFSGQNTGLNLLSQATATPFFGSFVTDINTNWVFQGSFAPLSSSNVPIMYCHRTASSAFISSTFSGEAFFGTNYISTTYPNIYVTELDFA